MYCMKPENRSFFEKHWKSTKNYASQWKYMRINKNAWKWMKINERLCCRVLPAACLLPCTSRLALPCACSILMCVRANAGGSRGPAPQSASLQGGPAAVWLLMLPRSAAPQPSLFCPPSGLCSSSSSFSGCCCCCCCLSLLSSCHEMTSNATAIPPSHQSC